MTRPLPPDLLGAALASAGLALVLYPPPQTGTSTTKTGTSCHTSPSIAPCAARSIAVGYSRSEAGSERTAECALTPVPARPARLACRSSSGPRACPRRRPSGPRASAWAIPTVGANPSLSETSVGRGDSTPPSPLQQEG